MYLDQFFELDYVHDSFRVEISVGCEGEDGDIGCFSVPLEGVRRDATDEKTYDIHLDGGVEA